MLCAGMGARVLEAGVDWSGANAADWFQAVGSVAAVGAAIWTAWNAGQQVRMAAKGETVRTVEMVCSIGFLMTDLCNAAFNSLKKSSPLESANFALVTGLFDAFPIDKFPSGEMALRLSSIHRLTVAFGEVYRDTVQAYSSKSRVMDQMEGKYPKAESAQDIFQRLEEICGEYDALVQAGQAILDRLPGARVAIPGAPSEPHH